MDVSTISNLSFRSLNLASQVKLLQKKEEKYVENKCLGVLLVVDDGQ